MKDQHMKKIVRHLEIAGLFTFVAADCGANTITETSPPTLAKRLADFRRHKICSNGFGQSKSECHLDSIATE